MVSPNLYDGQDDIQKICSFVSFVVLWPSRHMSSAASCPIHTVPKRLTSTTCKYFRQLRSALLESAVGREWMDELGYYVLSTVFQSFRDDGRVNMKGSVQ